MFDSPMPTSWVNVASEIDACRHQVRMCEVAFADNPESDVFRYEKEGLGHRLFQAHLRMLLLIEILKLPLFGQIYSQGFCALGDLQEVEHWHEDPNVIFSTPLVFINQHFEALSSMILEKNVAQVNGIDLLASILRNTPHILHARQVNPHSEGDVRNALHGFLQFVFPDIRKEIPIAHIFKRYRADLGSSRLKALVEVKYAVDEKELRSELDGIYADMRGYTGTLEWNHFFALFYTTAPIATMDRIVEEFSLANADFAWTPIIVHGVGDRDRSAKSTNKVK